MPTGKVGTSGSATPYPEARRALASSLCRRESVIGGEILSVCPGGRRPSRRREGLTKSPY